MAIMCTPNSSIASALAGGSVVSRENCHPFKWAGFWLLHRTLFADLTDEAFLLIGGMTDSKATFAMILSNLQHDGTTEETPFQQCEPFGHECLMNAIVKTIKQLEAYSHMDFPREFCYWFLMLNLCITDGQSVVVSRYCDRIQKSHLHPCALPMVLRPLSCMKP